MRFGMANDASDSSADSQPTRSWVEQTARHGFSPTRWTRECLAPHTNESTMTSELDRTDLDATPGDTSTAGQPSSGHVHHHPHPRRLPFGAGLETLRQMDRRSFLNGLLVTTGVSAIGVFAAACGSDESGSVATTDPGDAADTTATTSTEAPSSSVAATGAPTGGPDGGEPGGGSETLDDFVGLTTDGTVIDGLFSVQETGADTSAVIAAATAFLASLDDTQRAATLFDVEADEWRLWSNVHNYQRNGVSVAEMSTDQVDAGYALLQAALSVRGFERTRNIMKLNEYAAEVTGNSEFGEGPYYFTVLGTPSVSDPWGFQFEGHHLVLNYFVLGDQVVATPTFLGTEPRVALSGEYEGLSEFDDVLEAAPAVFAALDADQQAAALASDTKGEMRAEAFSDNAEVPYAGLVVDQLNDEQRSQLLDLVELFVGHYDDAHAAIKMDEIGEHLDETYFSWEGPTEVGSAFYFRIQSPVIYIEFDCQGPGPASDSANPDATQNHIHSITRTPNGNDYGKVLLARHLADSQ